MIVHANGQDRKAGVEILTSDKIDFKMKAIRKDKEGHYLMVKGSIQEEDIIKKKKKKSSRRGAVVNESD